MVVCVVLAIDSSGMWCNWVGTFARKPKAVNESFLVVCKLRLVGVKVFLFGATVLSKANVLLGLLLWVYALRREVLVILGCYLEYEIGEWFFLEDEVSFGSLVNVVDEDCSDGWLPEILLLKLSMVRDEFVLDLMEYWLWGVSSSLLFCLFELVWIVVFLFFLFFYLFKNCSTLIFYFLNYFSLVREDMLDPIEVWIIDE